MILRHLALGLLGSLLAGSTALAAHLSPETFTNLIFSGTITGRTGTVNGAGPVTLFFATDGRDYTLNPTTGVLSDPVPFVYEKTGDTTATLTEPLANGGMLNVRLTYTGAYIGTFNADYGSGNTQQGTFEVTPVPTSTPLVNMATRAFVPANGTAIAGLVIGGSVPRQVLLRAVGPGLAPFGIENRLMNPRFTVFRGTEAMVSNDDWSTAAGNSTLTDAFTRAGAFTLTAGSADAALVATMEPGAYTVVIRGGSTSDSGEVLAETYLLD